jgi:hypothetical protein
VQRDLQEDLCERKGSVSEAVSVVWWHGWMHAGVLRCVARVHDPPRSKAAYLFSNDFVL